MEKATFEALRPIILVTLFEKPFGVEASDEADAARIKSLEAFKPLGDSLSVEQNELFKKYDDDNSSSLAADCGDHYVAGYLDGIKKAMGLDPSVILKLLQSNKAVS
jgi:hypothetical protein